MVVKKNGINRVSFIHNFIKNDINVKQNNAISMPFHGDIMAPYLQNQISIMVNRIEDLISAEIYFLRFDYRSMIERLQLTKVDLGI